MGSRFPAGQRQPTVLRTSPSSGPPSPSPPGLISPGTTLTSRRRPHTVLLLSRLRIGVWRWPWMSRRGVRALLAEHAASAAS